MAVFYTGDRPDAPNGEDCEREWSEEGKEKQKKTKQIGLPDTEMSAQDICKVAGPGNQASQRTGPQVFGGSQLGSAQGPLCLLPTVSTRLVKGG